MSRIQVLRAVMLGMVVCFGTAARAQGSFEDLSSYEDRILRRGTTSDRTYYAERDEALTRTVDISQYVQRDEEGREREVLIMVRTGTRIFCAHCGSMLRNTVSFQHVPMEESVRFYDDGTHGDLVPDDGLPTYIEDIRTDYIGPWCYQHKVFLESLRDRAKYRDAHTARAVLREPLVEEEPHTFYSMVKVAPLDSDSRLAIDPQARYMPGTPGLEERFTFAALDEMREETVQDFEEGVIWEFKRPENHLDYWLHRNEIEPFVPQILEELARRAEARAATSTAVRTGSRTGRLLQDARALSNRPVGYPR